MNTGGNTAQGGQAEVDPSAISDPGYGGCRLYETEDPDSSIRRPYGRDWFTGIIPDTFFSSDFSLDADFASSDYEEEIIGRCCGNEVEDIGALARHLSEYNDFPNNYLCYNESSDTSVAGDFKWADARLTDYLYRILTLNRETSQFDAVSNSEGWFICRAGDGSIDAFYEPLVTDANNKRDKGVLLEEYQFIADVVTGVSANTQAFGGPEDQGQDNSFPPDLPPGASAGQSNDDILSEDAFSSTEFGVSGGPKSTACDKDGDGYPGRWRPSETAGPWYDPSIEPCRDPPPTNYDCDDGFFDLDGNYHLNPLSRRKNPGAINFCVNGVNEHLDCSNSQCIDDPTGQTTPEDMFYNPDAAFMVPRFVCHNTDDRGEFAECCGWQSGEDGFCFNTEKGRREGSAIHTLREFDTYAAVDIVDPENLRGKTNFVLRYGVGSTPDMKYFNQIDDDATYRFALFSYYNDLNITRWQEYKNLEFYIWYTANFEADIWLGEYTAGPGYSRNNIDNYDFPFKARILDYVVNEPVLRKWLHVVIPIEDIFTVDFNPEVIVLASNVKKLMKIDTQVTVPGVDGSPFSNVIGLDKIFLRPKDADLPQGAENLYCSGTWPPIWLTDLDIESDMRVTSQPAGRDACESIPSYGWTGTECCGDDTGEDMLQGMNGMTSFKEYYADTQAGCWAGTKVSEDSRAMMIQYDMFYSGYSGEVNNSCFAKECNFGFPAVQNVLIVNKHPALYDLLFVNGDREEIGAAGLSPNDYSLLRAENIPLQVLFSEEHFWGCNAEDYIQDMEDTVNGGNLIFENRMSEGPTCEIQGKYYCDHSEGADMGWRDEAVAVDPKSNRIIDEDGQEIEGAVFESMVAATYRSYAKRGMNLVKNGGFENV